MKLLLFFILLIATNNLVGQNSFENAKAISYKSVPVRTTEWKESTAQKSEIKFKGIEQFSHLKIKFSCKSDEEKLFLKIYNDKKLIQRLQIKPHSYSFGGIPDTAYIADINNDGRLDIKLVFWNAGCGLAGSQSTKVYLFQRDTLGFDIVQFYDYAWGSEYDIDNDGIYEIISTDHVWYKEHNYWVFNTYNYKDNKLINTSDKYDYPLWTRHLHYSDNKVAKNIPTNVRKKYKHIHPKLTYN